MRVAVCICHTRSSTVGMCCGSRSGTCEPSSVMWRVRGNCYRMQRRPRQWLVELTGADRMEQVNSAHLTSGDRREQNQNWKKKTGRQDWQDKGFTSTERCTRTGVPAERSFQSSCCYPAHPANPVILSFICSCSSVVAV